MKLQSICPEFVRSGMKVRKEGYFACLPVHRCWHSGLCSWKGAVSLDNMPVMYKTQAELGGIWLGAVQVCPTQVTRDGQPWLFPQHRK